MRLQMSKLYKSISLLLIALMLCSALISCSAEMPEDTPVASAVHTVSLIDGMTGKKLEVSEVADGKDYEYSKGVGAFPKYYGYTADTAKYDSDRRTVTEDTEITLEYLPAAETEITLLDIFGNEIHTVKRNAGGDMLTSGGEITQSPDGAAPAFPFIRRASPEEIREGKEYGEIIYKSKATFYEGERFSADDLTQFAPSELMRTFKEWRFVFPDGEFDLSAFEEGYAESGLTLRAFYTAASLALFNNEGAGLDSILINTVRDGNDIIPENPTKETVTDIFGERCTETTGTLRYIGTVPRDIYHYGSGETQRLQLTDGVTPFDPATYVNKFSGVKANEFGLKPSARIAIDYEQYASFTDGVLNILCVVRDETPYYLTGSYSNGNGDTEYDLTSHWREGELLWDAVDMIEMRYYIPTGERAETECDTGPCGYGGTQYNVDSPAETDFSKSGMRVAMVSREGELALRDEHGYKRADGKIIKMRDFVEVEDLTPDDSTRKTIMLTDSRGNDNGYAVGMKIRVQDYLDAIGGGDWTQKTVLLSPELIDRYGDCRDLSAAVKELNGQSLSKKLSSMSAEDFAALPKTDWYTAYNFKYDDDSNPETPDVYARDGSKIFCAGSNIDYKIEHFKPILLVNK